MFDYSKGKIYKLVSIYTNKVYYGSTIQKLSTRKAHHKHNKICKSKELFDLGFVDIIEIEKYPCNNKKELENRERKFIEEDYENCLNLQIPQQTRKEWNLRNKKKIAKKAKEYNLKNADKIRKYLQEKTINCECGRTIQKHGLTRHLNSKIHLEYLKSYNK